MVPGISEDENDNSSRGSSPTPVLYVRGEAEGGEFQAYLKGLRGADLADLTDALIPDCGHFSPEEQPGALAEALRDFIAASG